MKEKIMTEPVVIHDGTWDANSIYDFHDHFDFALSDREIKYDENGMMKGHLKITIEYIEEE